jgi:hypothetical protein
VGSLTLGRGGWLEGEAQARTLLRLPQIVLTISSYDDTFWLHHAVANNIPPDTWPSLLAPAPLTDVRGLYPIPPAKAGADPVETDLHHGIVSRAWSLSS